MQICYVLPSVITTHLRTNITEKSDQALIEAIAQRDKLAMRLLFTRHHLRVYRFAMRLTGNSATAEDIVNDVFFDVWRQASGLEAKLQVSTWLLATARNKAFSSIRYGSESQLDEDFSSTVADLADNQENSTEKRGRSAVLQHCLRQLTPAQREVIDLVYYHQMTVAEMSKIVNVPEKTVKTRMFCSRRRLSYLLAARNIYRTCSEARRSRH